VARVITTSARVREMTGGLDGFDVEATSVRRLIDELEARFPGLGEHVAANMAIAIDGAIHQDALAERFGADAELCLIPKLSGG
jgi:molybdopterin converting factor small subunit